MEMVEKMRLSLEVQREARMARIEGMVAGLCQSEGEEHQFPCFDGADARGWIVSAEKCFGIQQTPANQRMEIVKKAMTGTAAPWYQLLIWRIPEIEWPTFTEELLLRFGSFSMAKKREEEARPEQIGEEDTSRKQFGEEDTLRCSADANKAAQHLQTQESSSQISSPEATLRLPSQLSQTVEESPLRISSKPSPNVIGDTTNLDNYKPEASLKQSGVETAVQAVKTLPRTMALQLSTTEGPQAASKDRYPPQPEISVHPMEINNASPFTNSERYRKGPIPINWKLRMSPIVIKGPSQISPIDNKESSRAIRSRYSRLTTVLRCGRGTTSDRPRTAALGSRIRRCAVGRCREFRPATGVRREAWVQRIGRSGRPPERCRNPSPAMVDTWAMGIRSRRLHFTGRETWATGIEGRRLQFTGIESGQLNLAIVNSSTSTNSEKQSNPNEFRQMLIATHIKHWVFGTCLRGGRRRVLGDKAEDNRGRDAANEGWVLSVCGQISDGFQSLGATAGSVAALLLSREVWAATEREELKWPELSQTAAENNHKSWADSSASSVVSAGPMANDGKLQKSPFQNNSQSRRSPSAITGNSEFRQRLHANYIKHQVSRACLWEERRRVVRGTAEDNQNLEAANAGTQTLNLLKVMNRHRVILMAEVTLEQWSLLGKRIYRGLVQEQGGFVSGQILVDLPDLALSADTVHTTAATSTFQAGSSGDSCECVGGGMISRRLHGASNDKTHITIHDAFQRKLEARWLDVLKIIPVNSIREFMYQEGKLQLITLQARRFGMHILQAIESVLRFKFVLSLLTAKGSLLERAKGVG